MSYEILVGLDVLNDDLYGEYRRAMTPLLLAYGGDFSYDFTVSDVLKSESGKRMNRVFMINFPNKEAMDTFFSNADYLLIKEKYFNHSVGDTAIISSYEKGT